jgi:hypothetical protein
MKAILLFAFAFFNIGNQNKTTLNILISTKNNIFYYQDNLATDGSNFMRVIIEI